MKIITAISPKGGAGKTTILYCLAKAIHDSGKKVIVLDPDTNRSLSNMYERRMDFLEDPSKSTEDNKKRLDFPTVVSFKPSPTKLIRQIEDFGEGYDVVIVDTYGNIERYHNDLMYTADMVLIPTQPNQASINSALDTCDYIEQVRAENNNLPVYGVALLNFAKNGVEEKEYRRQFQDSYAFEIQTRPYGKAYKLADRRGLSITELDKIGVLSKADVEACKNATIDMRRLCNEIISVVGEL